MIGAVHYTESLSLSSLEEIWRSDMPPVKLLVSLQPLLARILVKPDQVLFLDMMKFTAMLVAELYGTVDKHVLCSFTERLLGAAHRAVRKYFSNPDFDQNRYLDCVAAVLSVWVDCTEQTELTVPKFITYTRASSLHILDTILQSDKISASAKLQLLDQITSLSEIETFVKYVIVGRQNAKCKLLASSQQPAGEALRCWLIKHNIATIRSAPEFLNSEAADEAILSAMCRPFYSLPPHSGVSPVEEEVHPEPASNPGTMFFIDRGSGVEPAGAGKKETSPMKMEISPMKEENSQKERENVKMDIVEVDSIELDGDKTLTGSPLCPLEDTVLNEPVEVAEPCIKIKNQRRRRSKATPVAREVIVLKTQRSETKENETKENEPANIAKTSSLTKEKLATLHEKPAARQSARVRRISDKSDASVVSIASVDSVASRTRNRRTTDAAPLAAITEEGKGRLSSVKRLKTPVARSTPIAVSTAGKRGKTRKTSEEVDETPQMPVRKTRSRKIVV